MNVLPAATTARRARRDGSGLELLEVLEHADHRVARSRMRLVRDRATEADAELRAQLGFDEAIRAKSLFGIVMIEIGFTTSGGDPHGGESGGTATRLRDGEFFHRHTEPLANQRNGRQSNQTIIVVIGPTEDRACH